MTAVTSRGSQVLEIRLEDRFTPITDADTIYIEAFHQMKRFP